ncbi:hypothetical protein SMC1_02485, partial [Candidatus Cryosericum septentrionale]
MTNTGLTGIRVTSLAINPKAPTTLYAGTDSGEGPAAVGSGGVFRSTNSGATWTAANTGLMTQRVFSLVINPLTPTTLYAVTGSSVFRSTDSGATWTAVNTGLTNTNVWSLAINPKTPATLYAGTYVG